jgi:soluble lytic murein transglycosylase
MQLKPGVAGHLASRCLGRRLKKNELRNPESNVTLGTVFLRELLRRHSGNWLPTLASYNAGPGMCSTWLSRFSGLDSDELLEQLTFPNTVAYVKKIVAVRDAYYSLYWPQLGTEWTRPGLARALPVDLEPYLDEEGGGCD